MPPNFTCLALKVIILKEPEGFFRRERSDRDKFVSPVPNMRYGLVGARSDESLLSVKAKGLFRLNTQFKRDFWIFQGPRSNVIA